MKTNVLMNPPFSEKWDPQMDERFEKFGLAPKSKADFAFLLHGYSKLSGDGTMAIVLPHGILFRGNAEGKIRRRLLEEGAIYAIVGLPANIFYGTSIPTVMIILKKSRIDRDVLFIDASKGFDKGKNQNVMADDHIQAILDAYINREDIEKYAHVASFDEIKENDFNCNIPRYIDSFEEEVKIDLGKTAEEIIKIDKEIKKNEADFFEMLNQLTGDEETMKGVELTKNIFR